MSDVPIDGDKWILHVGTRYETLAKILNAVVKATDDDIVLITDADGITIRGFDKARVTLVEITVGKGAFEHYKASHAHKFINVAELKKNLDEIGLDGLKVDLAIGDTRAVIQCGTKVRESPVCRGSETTWPSREEYNVTGILQKEWLKTIMNALESDLVTISQAHREVCVSSEDMQGNLKISYRVRPEPDPLERRILVC